MAKSMFVTFVVEAVAETNKSRVETLDWLGMQECRSPDCRSPTLMSVPVCVYVPSSLCACVSVPVCVCVCVFLFVFCLCVRVVSLFVCLCRFLKFCVYLCLLLLRI